MLPQPIFMAPPGGELHLQYANYFKRLENDSACDITMYVSAKDIATLNVEQIHNKLIALQHYPHLFKRFLNGVNFRFEHPKYKNRDMQLWELINPLTVIWFKKLMTFPAVPYFIKDDQLRYTIVAGDILLSGEFETRVIPGVPGFDVILDHHKMNLLTERLALGARFLQLFCYGTDVDPEQEVDHVLKSMNLILRYSMIRENLQHDLAWNRETAGGKYFFN